MAIVLAEPGEQLVDLRVSLLAHLAGQLRRTLGPEAIGPGQKLDYSEPVPVRSFGFRESVLPSGKIALRTPREYWRYFARVQNSVKAFLDVVVEDEVRFVRSQVGPAADIMVLALNVADNVSTLQAVNYQAYLFEVTFLEVCAVGLRRSPGPGVEELFVPAFGLDIPALVECPAHTFRKSLERAMEGFQAQLQRRSFQV